MNPWLTTDPEPIEAPAPVAVTTPATGPLAPQWGVVAPDRGLREVPVTDSTTTGQLWIVGAHGGAGETTLATALGLLDTDHRWPQLCTWTDAGHPVPTGRPAGVLVCARTSRAGLLAAQRAARQWAAHATPAVDLLGLVLIDDAPGRIPRPLRDLGRLVAGGFPRTWRIGWEDALRDADPDVPLEVVPRSLTDLRDAVVALTAQQ